MDQLTDMGIALVLSFLKTVIKNPEKKEQFKKAIQKVYIQIGIAYPEFLS